MVFDNQQHADMLLEASGIVIDALMMCEGMAPANIQMSDKQYNSAAAGAFGLI